MFESEAKRGKAVSLLAWFLPLHTNCINIFKDVLSNCKFLTNIVKVISDSFFFFGKLYIPFILFLNCDRNHVSKHSDFQALAFPDKPLTAFDKDVIQNISIKFISNMLFSILTFKIKQWNKHFELLSSLTSDPCLVYRHLA